MNPTFNFRRIAATRLAQAKIELESATDERLKYAALELRMAIEGVTYDRAMAFKAEIPPSELGTWQPRKLMQLLIDIEPHADQTSTFSMSVESAPGVPGERWHSLGTDKVFNLKAIREHYDALGSFVHLPSIKQITAGWAPDLKKLRQRCELIAKDLDAVLASPIHNVTLGSFVNFNCLRCQKPVRKRMPLEATTVEARCVDCEAAYEIRRTQEPGKVEWFSQTTEYHCLTEGCQKSFPIWRDQVKPGALFTCPNCAQRYRLQLYMVRHSDTSPTAAPEESENST